MPLSKQRLAELYALIGPSSFDRSVVVKGDPDAAIFTAYNDLITEVERLRARDAALVEFVERIALAPMMRLVRGDGVSEFPNTWQLAAQRLMKKLGRWDKRYYTIALDEINEIQEIQETRDGAE